MISFASVTSSQYPATPVQDRIYYITDTGVVKLNGVTYGGGSGGTVSFSSITGQPTDNANLSTALSEKYAKPASGIPYADLAASVKTSLDLANSALQTETYKGTITGITMNGASKGTSGVVNLGTVITAHQDISGKQDKVTAAGLLKGSGTGTITAAVAGTDYQEPLPSGTTGYFLKKTATGVAWAAVEGGGGSATTEITTSTGTSLSIQPGCAYRWTLTGNGTLSLGEGWTTGYMADAIILLSPGSYTLTCAGNISIVDSLQANKDNMCLVRWLGSRARLYVVDSEELGTITTQAVTADGTVDTTLSVDLSDYVTVSTGANAAYALAAGNILPAGLSLSSSGALSGTPTAESSATVTVNVTADGCTPATLLLTFDITAGTVVDLGTWTVEYSEMGEYVAAASGTYAATTESVTNTYGTFPVYSNGTYKLFVISTLMSSAVSGICWGLATSIQTDGANCTAYSTAAMKWYSYTGMGSISIRFNNTGSSGTGPYVSVSTTGYASGSNVSSYMFDGNYYLHSGTATSASAVWKLNSPVTDCYLLQENGSYAPWVIRYNPPTSYTTDVKTIVDNYYSGASYDSSDGVNVALANQITYNGCTSLYHAA